LDRLAAALADRYRVERELGAGGMATVYLAHDLRHERDVAIKVLHPDLGAALGADRFLAEIKTTAKLQHPHILPLLDSGAADTLLYYVMPYVRGETLRARLDREKQLPIADAVRIAREVAGALDHAHKQGIIHRDIKPENILLQDGSALVADFGIALAVQQAGTQRLTQTGLSLGTPQYMSPEQAMGEKTIDARSDIYALGAVTYEMLTGEAPFTGATAQAIVAKVLSSVPDQPSVVRRNVPASLDTAVMQALEKLPADRIASAQEFVAALGATSSDTTAATRPATIAPRRRLAVLGWTVAAVAGLGATYFALRPPPSGESTEAIFTIVPPANLAVARAARWLAISPDGKMLAFLGDSLGVNRVYVRSLQSFTAKRLDGTEGAVYMAFSPDSRSLGFVVGTQVRRVPVDGGASTLVTDQYGEGGVLWMPDNSIIFTRAGGRLGLSRVSASGGRPQPLTNSDSLAGQSHGWGVLLPDRRHIAFSNRGPSGREDDYLAIADQTTGKFAVSTILSQTPITMVNGYLVYVGESGEIAAVRVDLDKLAFVGDPVGLTVPLTSGLSIEQGAVMAENGTLYFTTGSPQQLLSQVRGNAISTIDSAAPGVYRHPRLSVDGRKVAFEIPEALSSNTSQVWVRDLTQGTRVRLSPRNGSGPAWSPDGKRVYFISRPEGRDGSWIYVRSADGSDDPRVVPIPGLKAGDRPVTLHALPDDRTLVVLIENAARKRHLYRLAMGDAPALTPMPIGGETLMEVSISRDGKWIAYVSNESGQSDVYVSALDGGARTQVSGGDGGVEPMWAADGTHLIYRGTLALRKMMEATLELGSAPRVVMRNPIADREELPPGYYGHANYDVFPDRSLLAVRQPGQDVRFAVALGWRQQLERALTQRLRERQEKP
jgi:serine/threonine-protein kinase